MNDIEAVTRICNGYSTAEAGASAALALEIAFRNGHIHLIKEFSNGTTTLYLQCRMQRAAASLWKIFFNEQK